MPLRIRPPVSAKSNNPTKYMTRWHGTVISKAHAMLPAINEIANHQTLNDLTTISVVGREGTGKSNLIAVITHYLHERMAALSASPNRHITAESRLALERPYGTFWFNDHDLVNFQKSLDSLPAVNRILVFDDVSFLSGIMGKRGMDKIKHIMTQIRHASTGVDYRTVLFFSFHYSKGLDIYLRDTHYRFITSVGGEEVKNYAALYGSHYLASLQKFKTTSTGYSSGHDARVPVGPENNKRMLTYVYRDPFGLALFHNGLDLRWMVYPGYDLVVPTVCSGCQHPSARKRMSKLTLTPSHHHKVHAFISRHCGGEHIAAQAARLMGFQRYGRPMYVAGANLKRAIEIIRRLERDQSFSLDNYLTDVMPSKIPRDGGGKIKTKWSTYISEEIQREYQKEFGVPALRPLSET